MPFTLSHCAVAAPLARWGLIMSPLVVGSMAPDFLFYLRLSTHSNWGHSPSGIILCTLPMALGALWCFHVLIKRPLLRLVPVAHRRRLLPYAGKFDFWPARRFLLILASLMLGIFTHLIMDSFTHDYGLLTVRTPFLQLTVLKVYGRAMPLYDLLQVVLSLGLMLVIVAQYARWFFLCRSGASLSTFLDFRTHLPLYLVLWVMAAIPAVIYACRGVPVVSDLFSLRVFAGRLILSLISILVVEILLLLALRAWRKRNLRK